MTFCKWIEKNTKDLSGKTVALTGSTGGLGIELCDLLARLGARLVFLDRNYDKSLAHAKKLLNKYGTNVLCIKTDLSDFASVRSATVRLAEIKPDVFIHNAGAYDIPRYKTDIGYDNVFQINFISPYYMITHLLPVFREKQTRVVAVSSIAHNYSKIDETDVDFSTRSKSSKVYGNAKRFLTFALFSLFEREKDTTLSIVHPGISFTGITNHYPKLIFAIIKYPMKIIFEKPRKACLSIVRGVFEKTDTCEWIGPRVFGVWGLPCKSSLKTASFKEREKIDEIARGIVLGLDA